MAIKYAEAENADELELSEGHWTKTTSPDGSRTYTAASDAASCTIRFRPPRADRVLSPVAAGSKVIKRMNGHVEVEQIVP